MSLINKMLQDLDARGSQAGNAIQAEVRPVPAPERGISRAVAIGAAAGLTAVLVALGWTYLHRPAAPALAVPIPVSAALAAPILVPAAVAASAVVAAPVPAPAPVAVAQAAPAPPAEVAAPAPEPVRQHAASQKKTTHATPEKTAQAASKRLSPQVAPATAKPAAPVVEGKQLSVSQRAENEYRRALDSLQDGRVPDAMARLQQALLIDPRHQASRETLVRLLLENQRPDEAMRQLQLGLELDPNQPAQAMMLARLQVEQGGPALDTLMRTLPFAAENGDYRAFLAGVLQHEQRNGEAAEQYRLALRIAPQNGVWWMGLGIALQADKHPAEAKQAFLRARAAPNLAPELLAFIDRKLLQLAAPPAPR